MSVLGEDVTDWQQINSGWKLGERHKDVHEGFAAGKITVPVARATGAYNLFYIRNSNGLILEYWMKHWSEETKPRIHTWKMQNLTQGQSVHKFQGRQLCTGSSLAWER